VNDYDPMNAPEPTAWLALDEQERISLVRTHHRASGIELENETLHAAMHVIVENQLAEQDEPVHQTLGRLQSDGLDRHDALHAVGRVLAAHVWKVMSAGTEASASPEKYYRGLKKLTAKKWRATR
jgi:hypothetical protein